MSNEFQILFHTSFEDLTVLRSKHFLRETLLENLSHLPIFLHSSTKNKWSFHLTVFAFGTAGTGTIFGSRVSSSSSLVRAAKSAIDHCNVSIQLEHVRSDTKRIYCDQKRSSEQVSSRLSRITRFSDRITSLLIRIHSTKFIAREIDSDGTRTRIASTTQNNISELMFQSSESEEVATK